METPTIQEIAAAAVKLRSMELDGYDRSDVMRRRAKRELNRLIDRPPHDVRRSLWRRDGKAVYRV